MPIQDISFQGQYADQLQRKNYFRFHDFDSGAGISIFPWTAANVGGGNAITTVLPRPHIGANAFRSVAGANTGFRMQISDLSLFRLAGNEGFTAIFFTPPVLTNVLARMGFSDSNNQNDATDGVYFEINGGILQAKTASNNTRTTVAMPSFTLTASTAYRIVVNLNNNATLATYQIYNMASTLLSSTTISTNIPTGSGRETGAGVVAVDTVGSLNKELITMDYMAVWIDTLLTR